MQVVQELCIVGLLVGVVGFGGDQLLLLELEEDPLVSWHAAEDE